MRLRRTTLALSIAALGGAAMLPASASTPADSGTLSPPSSPGTVSADWTGTVSGANANSDCSQSSVGGADNDHHTFTLNVPSGFYTTHTVKMEISETATGADSILTVNQGTKSLGSSDNSGPGGSESKTVTDPAPGSYDAITCAFAGASPYSASVTLTTADRAATTGPVGGTSTTAGPFSYGNYSLASIPGADQSGEPSIGVDWTTGNVYFQANLNTIKAKFPSYGASPVLTDVSCAATTVETLDPIMFTDSSTGRVGVSQLLANPVAANSITNFFDSTPEPTGPQTTCMPSQGGGEAAGPDHQTLGGGVYPKNLPIGAGPTTAYPNAFYYCSQTIAAGAECARSDDGGTTYVNGQPPYTTECGGLHGHVRVGPEGNVYLPNKSCGGAQGLLVSKDAGQTWKLQNVTGTTTSDGSDPSVSADRAGTVYFASVNADGRPQVSVSDNQGSTWKAPINIGNAVHVEKSVYPEVIAGDAGRATVAFVGSTTPGDRNLDAYGKSADGTTYTGGTFDLYISTTVDGGATWRTQDVTPNDPVQRGQICTNVTTCSAGRNLLDFNDITVDKTGHVLVGYADGCTAACVTSTKVADNKQTSVGVIARQITGPLLFVSGRFTPLRPARILDTRTSSAPLQATGPDRLVTVTGVGGVPSTGVSAVVLNATVPNPTQAGYLEVYPSGNKPEIATSNLNWRQGRTTANAVTVKVGDLGRIGLNVNTGSVHVALDVVGWYGDVGSPTGDYYRPLRPSRILDTRDAGSGGPLSSAGDRTLVVAGRGGIPATGASGVVLTLTATRSTAPAWVEVYPTGNKPVSPTSNTNLVPGQTVAALITSPIGSNGSLGLHVSAGSVQVVADVLGYYTSSGNRYVPLAAPSRLLDTRESSTPVAAGADRKVAVAGHNGIPANATGVVVNTTGVNGTDPTLNVEMYPTGLRPATRTSVLNLQDSLDVADLVLMPLGDGGSVNLSVSSGKADLVLDVVGYTVK